VIRVLFCLSLSICARLASAQYQYARYVSTSANSGGYYEYEPAGYNAYQNTKKYPLIVFLHGAGQFGNGDAAELPRVLATAIPHLIAEHQWPDSFKVNGTNFQFIVISPQFAAWPSDDDVNAIVQYAMTHYRVDTGRVYLTGLSMGGLATWSYASYSQWAGMLAAIVPIAADTNFHELAGARAMAQNNLPIFATHNLRDNYLPCSGDVYNINLVNDSVNPPIRPTAQLKIFNASGHDAWDSTYNPKTLLYQGLNIYQWMLLYSRDPGGNPPPPPPPPGMAITAFSPTNGGLGLTVMITGSGFTGASAVSFGGVAASAYTVKSDSVIVAIVGNGANGSVSVTTPKGTASLAGFIFDQVLPPVPGGFISFTAVPVGSKTSEVQLSWSDSSEQNNVYFFVQRSTDSVEFSTIDTVDAIPGMVPGNTYTDIDQQAPAGSDYYRIVQMHVDGTASVSPVRKVLIGQGGGQEAQGLSLSPNPATSSLYITIGGSVAESLEIRLIDLTGHTMRTWLFQKTANSWTQMVDIGDLVPGTYFIQAFGKNWNSTQAFFKR
jgi:dienelactone hydrolase